MAKIILTTDRNGQVTTRTEGVKGDACRQLTAPLEKALGTKLADNPTGEMYESTEVQIEQKIEE